MDPKLVNQHHCVLDVDPVNAHALNRLDEGLDHIVNGRPVRVSRRYQECPFAESIRLWSESHCERKANDSEIRLRMPRSDP